MQHTGSGFSANNKALLTQDNLRQSYADNYLTPLVTALKGTPGLYSYEIFNEPEGMLSTGWVTQWKIDCRGKVRHVTRVCESKLLLSLRAWLRWRVGVGVHGR
jgi:hypothetical protein